MKTQPWKYRKGAPRSKNWKPRRHYDAEYADGWTSQEAEVVGKIVIAFSQLEHMLHLAETRMHSIRWEKYWTVKGYRTKIKDRLASLRGIHTQVYGKPMTRKWERLLREIEIIADDRNDIVHSLWCVRNGKKERRKEGRALSITPKRWLRLLARIQFIRDTLGKEYWRDPKPPRLRSAPTNC